MKPNASVKQNTEAMNAMGDHQAVCKDCVPMMKSDQMMMPTDKAMPVDHMKEMTKGM